MTGYKAALKKIRKEARKAYEEDPEIQEAIRVLSDMEGCVRVLELIKERDINAFKVLEFDNVDQYNNFVLSEGLHDNVKRRGMLSSNEFILVKRVLTSTQETGR